MEAIIVDCEALDSVEGPESFQGALEEHVPAFARPGACEYFLLNARVVRSDRSRDKVSGESRRFWTEPSTRVEQDRGEDGQATNGLRLRV